MGFIGFALCNLHLCGLQVHKPPVPAPTAKGTTCSRSICERNFIITLPHCCTPPPWALIPFVGEITHWGAFNWRVNIIHRDTILPKSLSLWVWTQLCYINSPTSLLLLHMGLPLTHVYPINRFFSNMKFLNLFAKVLKQTFHSCWKKKKLFWYFNSMKAYSWRVKYEYRLLKYFHNLCGSI